MGWASAGEIFDPIAKAMVELGASDEMKIRVLGDLIAALQEGDWDTEDESLSDFDNDPAIVEAFRRHGVFRRCDEIKSFPSGGRWWCEREIDHRPDYHENWRGDRWPVSDSTGN